MLLVALALACTVQFPLKDAPTTPAHTGDTGMGTGTDVTRVDSASDPVEGGGDGCITLEDGATYATLQEAVDAAPDGGEVLVCPRVPFGSVVIDHPVVVTGTGGDVTLRGSTHWRVLRVESPGVVLRGLTVRGETVGVHGGVVQVADGGGLTLVDCVVTGAVQGYGVNGGGIWVGPGGRLDLQGTRIEGNRTSGFGGGLFVSDGATVTLDADSALTANSADWYGHRGGGAWLDGPLAVLVSNGADWGVGSENNSGEDVQSGGQTFGPYGGAATFTCSDDTCRD